MSILTVRSYHPDEIPVKEVGDGIECKANTRLQQWISFKVSRLSTEFLLCVYRTLFPCEAARKMVTQRGNFILKRFQLLKILTLSTYSDCWSLLLVSAECGNAFLCKRRILSPISYSSLARKGSLHSQYGQEEWLQGLFQCTYALRVLRKDRHDKCLTFPLKKRTMEMALC